jgi:hypothetical protein
MNTNFLHKEFIRSFFYDNKRTDREFEKEEIINGRTYYKLCVATVTTLVGNLYKVYDSSDKRFKYCLIVGMARQHPNDNHVTREEGIEKASENALISPSIVMEFDHEISWPEFRDFAQLYIETIEPRAIKTREEIIEGQKDDEYGKKYPNDVFAFKLFTR